MSSFETNLANTRTLINIILYACKEKLLQEYMTDNAKTECAYYPESKTLVVINNSEEKQSTGILTEKGKVELEIKAYDTIMIGL
ncbi:hypothetical protein CG709_20285 [Lachnotalea glycerini]|nr:hypothetical protein CG709_20285 [Lachnotalea glycerini]